MKLTASYIREENKKRNRDLRQEEDQYNPYIGAGSNTVERTPLRISDLPIPLFYAPKEMLCHDLIKSLEKEGSIFAYLQKLNIPPQKENVRKIIIAVEKIRIKTDFEYTAASYFKIKPKPKKDPFTGQDIVIEGDIPFILNRGQRKLLKVLESFRLRRKSIRIILLKARQWGGSTLVQLYMAWMQLFHHRQWNSTICAHVENTARIVKGMYTKILKYIPVELVDNVNYLMMRPYEKSAKTSIIEGPDCRITIGSAEKPDGVRGEDTVMAHCTEIGIWKVTKGKTPEDILNSVTSGIPMVADSIVVYESTAKGVGNLFHREWLRAKSGENNMTPVFISWFDIENNAVKIDNVIDFINSMTDYEYNLWEKGATLEQINWYRNKSKEYPNEWGMRQEFPSDDIEAFQSSGKRKFDIYQVQNMRKFNKEPLFYATVESTLLLKECDDSDKQKEFLKNSFIKKLEGVPNKEDNLLKVWALPTKEYIRRRYVVSVDIGGKSDKADWSVITVFDRKYMTEIGGVPEKVAQWRGHIDHDLLAWLAAMIATIYDNALLVFESNTFETEKTEGQHFEYILDELGGAYDNLYCRNSAQRIKENLPPKWGFHTGESSKTMIMDNMTKMLREEGYYERDLECCNEMDQYEIKEDGKLGAIEGCHDDILMSTAIGVYVCYDFKYFPMPEIYIPYEHKNHNKQPKIRNESTF
ncbi:hypothetical protein [Dysgonomonas termitidis]|uniref:Terminase n=1 Tax=Dysgonomonas termitidis TaxID=1516126 RepID=A0ABV9L182_9BACT